MDADSVQPCVRLSPSHSFTIFNAGRMSHPHPLLINQEVISTVQLFIEATSCESTPLLSWLDRVASIKFFMSLDQEN